MFLNSPLFHLDALVYYLILIMARITAIRRLLLIAHAIYRSGGPYYSPVD
mgnify:CR=1 FL=1